LPKRGSSKQVLYQNRYYNEYHEGLLEIAKTFLNILLNQIVDKTMVTAVVKVDVNKNEDVLFVA
jgi:hypothetical protein